MLIKKWNKTRKVFLSTMSGSSTSRARKSCTAPATLQRRSQACMKTKLKNEIAERKMFPGRFFPRVKFSDLAKEYLEKHAARTRSYADYWSISNKLIKALGDKDIHDIQKDMK